MRQLKQKRKVFKQELAKFRAILDNYEAWGSLNTVQFMLENLEAEYYIYTKHQCDLDEINEGQTIQERLDIKQEFMDCNGRATDIIERAKGRSRDPIDRNMLILPGTSHSEPVCNDIAVPKMQLPTFSGAYEDWPRFANQFRCTIYENARFDDCTRLMYLRSCLT